MQGLVAALLLFILLSSKRIRIQKCKTFQHADNSLWYILACPRTVFDPTFSTRYSLNAELSKTVMFRILCRYSCSSKMPSKSKCFLLQRVKGKADQTLSFAAQRALESCRVGLKIPLNKNHVLHPSLFCKLETTQLIEVTAVVTRQHHRKVQYSSCTYVKMYFFTFNIRLPLENQLKLRQH